MGKCTSQGERANKKGGRDRERQPYHAYFTAKVDEERRSIPLTLKSDGRRGIESPREPQRKGPGSTPSSTKNRPLLTGRPKGG